MKFFYILLFLLISCGYEEEVTEKTAEQIIQEAQDSSDTLISTAQDSSDTLISTAQDSSDTLISTAQDSVTRIIDKANNKAKEITSKAKVRQEFLDKNSLLLLAVVAFLIIGGLSIIVYLTFTWRKEIYNKTIELPEIFRSDWKKLSKSISLLSTKEESAEDIKKLKNLVERFISRLSDFARKININAENNKDEYVKGLQVLTQQLEEKSQENKKLREGYSNRVRKHFILELISIKEMIENFRKKELNEEAKKQVNNILEQIDRVFRREGVHKLTFKEGTDLTTLHEKEHEPVDQVFVDDSSKSEKIYKTEKVGYYLEGLENSKTIILPAKVSVYSYKSKEKSPQDEAPTEETAKESSVKDTSSEEFEKKIINDNREKKE